MKHTLTGGLRLKAYAKINLALDVLHKRDDGYHQVEMIMQAIDLADNVILYEQDGDITVEANVSALACDKTNLAYRAAELLRYNFGIKRGVNIILEKNIPMAAGLAGGSADAAAVLDGLNRLWNIGLTMSQLEELGASLGSDIPFCLQRGTMLATGRGEILTRLPDLPECFVVLAKPDVNVSTAWVYGQYRPENIKRHPDIQGMIHCIKQQDLPGVAAKVCNVLESVTIPAYPEISEVKEYMRHHGALNSMMSGSGPTVFGLTRDQSQAEYIAEKLKSHVKFREMEVIVAKTLGERV